MDHLPTASFEFAHIEIPYLFDQDCPFIYDNQSWTEYPVRAGWDLGSFLDGDFTNRGRNTAEQAASLLQAWLYFGMIHRVTGIPVQTSDFVRTTNLGNRVVHSGHLGPLISQWEETVKKRPIHEVSARTAATDRSAKAVTDALSLYLGWKTPLSDTVILSINILHRTLICAKRAILAQSDFEPHLTYFQGSREIIDNQLYQRGWCRRDVARHHQGQSCLGMYFAISLGPRLVPRDHSDCLITECLALQVDHATYKSQHTDPDCDCAHLEVDVAQVCSLINSGRTPLLRLSDSTSGGQHFGLDVITDSEYVCISHVWANGFGNLHANSMPLCQLTRLQNRVNNLYNHGLAGDNIPFWIDTLCVPVQRENTATRRRAIVAMGKIYEQAAKVLVVDVELLRSTTAGASLEEIAMRISYSVWWSRLWTLQEAVFARQLHFQFQDCALDGKELVARSDTAARDRLPETDWSAAAQIAYEGLAYLRELYAFKSSTTEGRASYILQAVNWRSTSWKSDEAVCLAGIMELKVQDILTAPDQDRLRRFILMQRFFPAVSLFFSGAKMDTDGIRWAPRTFVFSRAGLLPAYQQNPDRGGGGSRFELQTTSLLAQADETGLHVQFPGFKLGSLSKTCSRVAGDRVLFQDASDTVWYTFRVMGKNTVATPFLDLVDNLSAIPDLAIVLPQRPTVALDRTLYYGVLVSIYRDGSGGGDGGDGGVLFSRLVARVSVDRWGAKDPLSLKILLGIDGDPDPVEAVSLPETQRWCIG
ncbi:uncharacterized protein Z520_12382 [Fonsecaea multimorphosa CBS 102226]|uniref:Heterokaryon incompatibility domain-containing protein n=1 Tax=Fonsecaea multimorphosa CBS 102226 TaxID=1442371 RepID=A0A0D2JN82_9EURO|nr:uncharacterized protein Z520_12382 [Fonsecaea multimorphosa CBS 102226]KIX91919.1 hypothetical protein Z520_12382 [Fonsecaea multimorphosa CBS 102226]